MASPIPKFPEIIKSLYEKNYKKRAGIEQIKTEIMRITGAMNEATLTRIVQAMSRLGYIKDTGRGGLFYMCQNGEPYIFPKEKKGDSPENEVDNLLSMVKASKPEE